MVAVFLASVGLLWLGVYIKSYRWARALVGSPEPEPVPHARVVCVGATKGPRVEPGFVRPVQAGIIAFGIAGAGLGGLAFLGLLASHLLASVVI